MMASLLERRVTVIKQSQELYSLFQHSFLLCVERSKMTEEQSPLSQEEEPLPLLLYADVSIDVIRARNLPRGLLAPRAQVLVFCPFIEQPIATTDSAPRCTAPEWNFSEKIVLPHLPSALPLIKFVVVDTSAGQSTFGSASISLSAPATRAYIPLDAPATRADLLVSVRWHSCPFPVSPLLPRPLASADSAAAGGPELRAVDPRPGAIFRTGSILVEVTAAGIPASVAQPFLHVRTSDQILRGGETVHSREWWDRRYQREQLQSSDSKTSSDISSDALFTPKASYDSASSPTELEHSNNVSSDGVHFDDGETLANANVSGDNEILPNANASGDNDTLPNVNASIDDEGQGDCNKGKPYTLSGHKSLRQGLRQKVSQLLKEGIVDEKLEKLENMKKNAENIKKKLNKTSLDSLQNARPTRSAIGATVTAAKVRRGKSNKTDRQVPSSQPSASPPQKTPASVLQTLLAPRVRRSVDFGSFEFAEFTIGPPKRLSLKITDKDSHLPSALGAVFETDLPLDLLETGESSIVLTTCENGPVRAKVSIWVRITRLRDADACPAPVNIVTPKFMQVLDDSERLAADFKTKYTQAERLTYLFVGGLFTNHYPLYFSRNVDYLQQKLLLPRVQCIPINTESGLAANAKVIAASVAKTATRRNSVVLIGHSKGGCDILHAVTHHIEIIPFMYVVAFHSRVFLLLTACFVQTWHHFVPGTIPRYIRRRRVQTKHPRRCNRQCDRNVMAR